MRVLFAGGGTGGHVYPALAIAKYLLKQDNNTEILFIGTKVGMESKIIPKEGFAFETITVQGLERKISLGMFKTGFKAIEGLGKSISILRKYNPQLVIGTGGYVCGPVVLAARILGIPTIIHEQNALPGMTNKLLGKIVDQIMITFPDSDKYFKKNKVKLTGLPVREQILDIKKEEGIKFLNLDSTKKTILITGGSRGAKNINNAMACAYKDLLKKNNLQFIHITGESGYKDVLNNLIQQGINLEEQGNIILKPYLYEMEYAISCADLCISRAGATFLAEMTAKGIPSILIPYPFASENHQEYNAKSLVNRNAAMMILDKDLSGEKLLNNILSIIDNDSLLSQMTSSAKKAGNVDSLENIMQVIVELTDYQ
ncbi:UDP-N-acetylglucosamine-N-acetylmuramylpentapeptide N-acetylglucosamine transferase [Desulfonispora thiosulfatigenes DSM 11270]|uniref:UDP-N-acetylglucosamine--N-acetylmuramyl-(pentapeptide) pyrophosphoryl-undecaprenol N-acetylglucosamine transferase n=1 Tax=Desulfonispora thiosulfatigenes DSM 11270 TaxID=656914 RepID=A0A1W1VSU7_DESTI|nr:undecaprenyldiphospho-muramoylpentapeptide beta-N-acetylglucosaminyltransferase [Desulfonispora thiosulfatigenes]SMB96428.1 UDP-N-acetylglucosamine-N-acetylmuramylpentapeptide N-acetylglucosamine transferase [Desulfonispora thiosulfatigenes DSM 11270]